jgi:hypothetical protein
MYRRPFATVIALAITLVPSGARATSPFEDPYDLPDAPRSLSLPELTHPDFEWTSTTSLGSIAGPARKVPETLERLGAEFPLGSRRRWYAGAAYEVAYGSPLTEDAGATIVGGNPEVYIRTVWASRTGIAFGGGLGLLLPFASYARAGQGADVASAATSLQPWDAAYFRVGAFTARPYFDVRDLIGPVVIQFRQSFDWSMDTKDLGNRNWSAASTLYFGWLATPILGVGLEATEYYLIDADVPDDRRAKTIVTPHIRFFTPGIQPAIGVFAGFGSPLDPAAGSVWGARFALTFVWDPSRPFFRVLQINSP